MRKEKEQTINGTKFKVTQLGFADGMELLTTLGHIQMAQLRPRGELWRFFRRGGFVQRRFKTGRSEFHLEPPDIPWVVHRIVTSKHYRASLIEVQQKWSLDDVVDAHQVLDYFGHLEYLEIRAARKI